jgi:putative pyruvate formate lyase activating enzyme
MSKFEPVYFKLYKSGELKRRSDNFRERLSNCDICPRNCGVNRIAGEHGFCHSSYLPVVSSFCAHRGEEPPISGSRGSGTIFFGNCNMRCVYCQNFQISQEWREQQKHEVDISSLATYMLHLQNELKCHNINLVTPSHFVPQIVMALIEAVSQGLHIPLVYNTSGYDALQTIKQLDGIIDIYLPDLRYAEGKIAGELSRTPDYVSNARKSIKEMYRQVGNLMVDDEGVALKGLIIRHLILPNRLAGSESSLKWLVDEISPEINVSIMAQYYPIHKAIQIPAMSRRINCDEYSEVIDLLRTFNINNGWLQEMDAPENYQPDFSREGHPFE